LNLLLDGYVFCRLEPWDQIRDHPMPIPIEPAAFLVYDGTKYVGYLNVYGDFGTISENMEMVRLKQQQHLIRLAVLFFLQWIFFSFSVIIGVRLFWLRCKRKAVTN